MILYRAMTFEILTAVDNKTNTVKTVFRDKTFLSKHISVVTLLTCFNPKRV